MGKLNIVPGTDNKSVYFLLPLLSLSKLSYGHGENFINSFVSYNGKLIVLIYNKEIAGAYFTDPYYNTDFEVSWLNGTATAIVYSIDAFEDDFGKFLEGKYSEFSEESKDKIKKTCGLPYKVPSGNTKITHKLLMVLDKSLALRHFLEQELETTFSEDQELLEKPDFNLEYLDIDAVHI